MSTQQDQGSSSDERVTIGASDVGELRIAASPAPHAPHAKSAVVIDKEAFCAGCQTRTVHKASVVEDRNGNNEIVHTCDCGRFFKTPLFETPDEYVEHLTAHHAANVGQITVEQDSARRAEHDKRFLKLLGIVE